MKKELTISIDSHIMEAAQNLAQESGMTLSELFEDTLMQVGDIGNEGFGERTPDRKYLRERAAKLKAL